MINAVKIPPSEFTDDRLKEIQIDILRAVTLEERIGQLNVEIRFQKTWMLHVLGLAVLEALRDALFTAQQRLDTCLVIAYRMQANPQRADDDGLKCASMIAPLENEIFRARGVFEDFVSAIGSDFQAHCRAYLDKCVLFNAKIRKWNRYVHSKAKRHAIAKRRSFMSAFTLLRGIQDGTVNTATSQELLLKLQIYEGLDSSIDLTKQARDLLLLYRKRLADLDGIPSDVISKEQEERWMVELSAKHGRDTKKKTKKRSMQLNSSFLDSFRTDRSQSFSVGSSRRDSLMFPTSASEMESSIHRGSVGSFMIGERSRSNSECSTRTQKKRSKKERFKLYKEARDDQRSKQYERLKDSEVTHYIRLPQLALELIRGWCELEAVNSNTSATPRPGSGRRSISPAKSLHSTPRVARTPTRGRRNFHQKKDIDPIASREESVVRFLLIATKDLLRETTDVLVADVNNPSDPDDGEGSSSDASRHSKGSKSVLSSATKANSPFARNITLEDVRQPQIETLRSLDRELMGMAEKYGMPIVHSLSEVDRLERRVQHLLPPPYRSQRPCVLCRPGQRFGCDRAMQALQNTAQTSRRGSYICTDVDCVAVELDEPFWHRLSEQILNVEPAPPSAFSHSAVTSLRPGTASRRLVRKLQHELGPRLQRRHDHLPKLSPSNIALNELSRFAFGEKTDPERAQ
jgi:hypothetical protein